MVPVYLDGCWVIYIISIAHVAQGDIIHACVNYYYAYYKNHNWYSAIIYTAIIVLQSGAHLQHILEDFSNINTGKVTKGYYCYVAV